MKKALSLILALVMLISLVPMNALAADTKHTLTLDDIAWNGMTYKDIFVDKNIVYMNGFDDNTWNDYKPHSVSKEIEITREQFYSPAYSLKCFSTSASQQITKTPKNAAIGEYFLASKAYCTRYVKGTLGICLSSDSVGLTGVTDGFETTAGIVNMKKSGFGAFVGSFHSANLDGYVDDPVAVPMSIFGSNKPTLEQLTALYNNYAELQRVAKNENVNKFSDDEKLAAFIEYMNDKAFSIGMTNSHFNDPVGMNNLSTANDLLKLLVYADTYSDITGVWGNASYQVDVGGNNARKQTATSTYIKKELSDYYTILGGKTGTLTSYNARNLAAVLAIPGSSDRLAVVTLYADGKDGSDSSRFDAARQAADIAMAVYKDPNADVSAMQVCCKSAVACLIPAEGADLSALQILYAKDADRVLVPASITKLLTAICALDVLGTDAVDCDLEDRFTYHAFDTEIGGFYGKDFAPGDTITYHHSLYAMILPSSNVTAMAVARNIGGFILENEIHVHKYTSVVTDPSCTEQGYTTYTCICGDSYVDDYVDATGVHSYENGICSGCGSTTIPYLQQLPEYITGCSNLYDILTPTKGYYTATKYDTSNGAVLSVVIPVEPGDRIAASSFGPESENMGSVDGIRVTYLLDGIIVKSLPANSVYTTYTQEGYLTVPEGVNMVSVPWWAPSNGNWLTLAQISKNFAAHSHKVVPAQAPTCTENGYTAGEICEFCDASLGSREEIPATGHDYNENTCTICGTVNVLAILDGKYVSVLGDSISTFNGYSNDATANTTIGGNGPRYDIGTADTKPGSYCLLESVDDTWWMHFANRSGMKLLVNNSWAGSQVFGRQTSDGRQIPPAYLERCINLHDNTIENNPGNAPINPDVIFVYLGINDYNFNRNNVGNGAVDYAKLVSSDGTYVTPTTFSEAYGILLHKMQNAYPDAQIFAMTLLPENLYSVNMTSWEQHNAYIRAAAEYYDIPLVDLAEKCAITWENYSGYMIDKIHPTTAGMELISDCIETELLIYYKENRPHNHTPVIDSAVAATCTETGLTEGSHCETCGEVLAMQEMVPATGHTYEKGICTVCDKAQPSPNIVTQPADVEATLGEQVKFAVEAVGKALRYLWYYRDADESEFRLASTRAATYTVNATASRNGRQVYCVITDALGNKVTTDVATLTVIPAQALEIVNQPQNTTAILGESVSVTVDARGEGLKYLWYYRDADESEFRLASTRAATYTVNATASRNGRQVYCVITDALGNKVTTDVATLTVVPSQPLKIVTQPKNITGTLGEDVSFTVGVEGDGLKYRWYYRDAKQGQFARTAITTEYFTFEATATRNGRQVYCVITDALGNEVTTDVATLTVIPAQALEIVNQPQNTTAILGESVSVTVDARGEGLKYLWYYRDADESEFRLASTRAATYTVNATAGRNGRQIYCVITDAMGNKVTTEIIVLTVV